MGKANGERAGGTSPTPPPNTPAPVSTPSNGTPPTAPPPGNGAVPPPPENSISTFKGDRPSRNTPTPSSATESADRELLRHMEEAERYYKMDKGERFQAATSLEDYRRALMLYHDPRAQHLPQASHYWDKPLTEEQRIAIAMIPIRNSNRGKPSEARNTESGFLQHATRYLSLALSQPGMENTSYAQEAVELGELQADEPYSMQECIEVQRDRVLLLGKHLSSLYGINRDSTYMTYAGLNKSRVHFYDGATHPLDIWAPEQQAHSYPFENGRYLINLAKVASGKRHIEHLEVLRRLLEEENPLEGLNGAHVALGVEVYKKQFQVDNPMNPAGVPYSEAKGRGFAEHLLRAHLIPLGDFERLGALTEEYNPDWALAALEWSNLNE